MDRSVAPNLIRPIIECSFSKEIEQPKSAPNFPCERGDLAQGQGLHELGQLPDGRLALLRQLINELSYCPPQTFIGANEDLGDMCQRIGDLLNVIISDSVKLDALKNTGK